MCWIGSDELSDLKSGDLSFIRTCVGLEVTKQLIQNLRAQSFIRTCVGLEAVSPNI